MNNVKDKTAKLIFGMIAVFALWATIKDCQFDAPPLQPVVTKKTPASSGSLLARTEFSPFSRTDDLAGRC